MAWAAEQFQAATSEHPDVLRKWQAIQENLPALPANALRDFMVDFWRAVGYLETGHADDDAIDRVIDDWYRRALFVKAQRERVVEAVLTADDWKKLPKRSFK